MSFMEERMPVPEPVRAYTLLRDQALSPSPTDLGFTPSVELHNVWGVLFELGFSEGAVTLVSLADGTTSLYFGHGAGIIGSGARENVKRASRSLLSVAEDYVPELSQTDSFPLPDIRRVVFNVLTFSGPLTVDVAREEVEREGNGLLPLYAAGQAVLNEIRRPLEEPRRLPTAGEPDLMIENDARWAM